MLDVIINLLIASILLGGIYVIIASGLNLLYGVVKFLNIAYGATLMIGCFVSFWLWKAYGIAPLFALPIVSVFMAGVYGLMYGLVSPILGRCKSSNEFENTTMLLTFGLIFVLENTALYLWGANYRSISYFGSPLTFGDITFSSRYLIGFIISIIVAVLFYWFLNSTKSGKIIRAIPQERVGVALMGINVRRNLLFSFLLSGLVIGAASTVVSFIFVFYPSVGLSYTVLSICIMTLGGMGNYKGLIIGGFLIALLETLTSFFIGGIARDFVLFFTIILVFLVRPSGAAGSNP